MTSLNLTHFNIIKMKRSYKYRIYPNILQQQELSDIFDFFCDKCGLTIDRDKNAAINIKNLIVLAPGTGAQELVFREAPAFMQG